MIKRQQEPGNQTRSQRFRRRSGASSPQLQTSAPDARPRSNRIDADPATGGREGGGERWGEVRESERSVAVLFRLRAPGKPGYQTSRLVGRGGEEGPREGKGHTVGVAAGAGAGCRMPACGGARDGATGELKKEDRQLGLRTEGFFWDEKLRGGLCIICRYEVRTDLYIPYILQTAVRRDQTAPLNERSLLQQSFLK